MVEVDLVVLQSMIQKAVSNADTFNKVWIAGAAVLVSLAAALIGVIAQFLTSYWQRMSQKELAKLQSDDQRNNISQQLAMQELASKRIAAANIGEKRQVWIDNLRMEISDYLSIWQDIAWRWEAAVIDSQYSSMTDEKIAEFKKPIIERRFLAHGIQIRIQLRLNIKEKKHQTLINKMKELEDETTKFNRSVSNLPTHEIQKKIKEILFEITFVAQEILKEEWDRVKKDAFVPP